MEYTPPVHSPYAYPFTYPVPLSALRNIELISCVMHWVLGARRTDTEFRVWIYMAFWFKYNIVSIIKSVWLLLFLLVWRSSALKMKISSHRDTRATICTHTECDTFALLKPNHNGVWMVACTRTRHAHSTHRIIATLLRCRPCRWHDACSTKPCYHLASATI